MPQPIRLDHDCYQSIHLDVCPTCLFSVLVFRSPGRDPVVWDPTAGQRRWVRGEVRLAEWTALPPFSWAFGRKHQCPPPTHAPKPVERKAGRDG